MNNKQMWRFVPLLTLFTLVLPGILSAQTPGVIEQQRTIRVSGSGESRAVPDQATVLFGVQTTGVTAQEAGEANAELMDRVIRALTSAGVRQEDIQTSGYSLYPEYAPRPCAGDEMEPPEIRGYRASNQLSVRTMEIDGIGALIDVGLSAGANQMQGVSFELRNSAAAEAEALREAVQRAEASAQTMADALGVRLGAVIDASTSSEPVRPMMRASYDAVRMEMAAAPPTPIQPGEQTVRATAWLIFAIE